MKFSSGRKKTGNLNSFIESHNRRIMENIAGSYSDESLVGKELSIKITAIGSKGDGIGRHESFTVIVPGTKVNDKVNVIVQSVRGKLIFAAIKNDNQE
ncbi:TRAM domain-containing protein [Candidatus Woesearchaeota archaeon]|nr:TRAM domain-containing protein [Candidatus Woesearchaeota archaeon]